VSCLFLVSDGPGLLLICSGLNGGLSKGGHLQLDLRKGIGTVGSGGRAGQRISLRVRRAFRRLFRHLSSRIAGGNLSISSLRPRPVAIKALDKEVFEGAKLRLAAFGRFLFERVLRTLLFQLLSSRHRLPGYWPRPHALRSSVGWCWGTAGVLSWDTGWRAALFPKKDDQGLSAIGSTRFRR